MFSELQLGSTAIGIQTSQGVVLAAEKRLTSVLLESSSIEKIMEIDSHIGATMSGLTGDARTMIEHARVEAQVCAVLLAPPFYTAPYPSSFSIPYGHARSLLCTCLHNRHIVSHTTNQWEWKRALKQFVIWPFVLERTEKAKKSK